MRAVSAEQTNMPHIWRQVIQKVERANLKKLEIIKQQEKTRKIAYCDSLNNQVQQHQKRQYFKKNQKTSQRALINSLVQQEFQSKVRERDRKMKTQQKYQAENLTLFKPTKIKEYQKYPENPFVTLVDKQEDRRQNTKMRFQLQNYLNTIQSQIKRQSQKKNVELQRIEKKIYEQHVEEEFRQKIRQRQKFKNQYLKAPISSTPNTPSNKFQRSDNEYLGYLNQQVTANKVRKTTEKNDVLDDKLQKLNEKVDQPDSSPAYLGRNICSDDRAKQCKYIDRALKISHNQAYHPQSAFCSIQQAQIKRLEKSADSIRKQITIKRLPKISKLKGTLQNSSQDQISPTPMIGNPRYPVSETQCIDKGKREQKNDRLRDFSADLNPEKIAINQINFGPRKREIIPTQSLQLQRQKKDKEKDFAVKSFARYDFISGITRSYMFGGQLANPT